MPDEYPIPTRDDFMAEICEFTRDDGNCVTIAEAFVFILDQHVAEAEGRLGDDGCFEVGAGISNELREGVLTFLNALFRKPGERPHPYEDARWPTDKQLVRHAGRNMAALLERLREPAASVEALEALL